MNRVIESRVIFLLNEGKEDFYFNKKEIEENIKDLELIFEPYLEYLQNQKLEQNSDDNEN